ncbi:ABC transporter substrate-binding protein [Thermodesulfobacteriota bacterium]
MKTGILKKALMVLVMMVFVIGLGSSAFSAEKTKIAISAIVQMTGPYATSQVGIMEGNKDCIEYLNSINYVPGAELVYTWQDGGSDTAKSMTAFKKLVNSNPPPVANTVYGSAFSIALKKWHMKNKVPEVAASYSDSFQVLPSWTFVPMIPYPNMIGAWIDYYLKHIWKDKSRKPRLALMLWDTAGARGFATKEIKAFIKSRGVEIVAEEYIPLVPTDTSPQLLRIKEKKADFAWGAAYYTALSVVLKDMKRLGMMDQMTIGCPFWATPEQLVKLVPDLAEGLYFINDRYMHSETAKKKGHIPWKYFEKRHLAKLGTKIYTLYSLAWFYPWVEAEAVRIAAADVGPDKVDGTAVYNALQKMKDFDAGGLILPMSFGPKRRFGILHQVMVNRVRSAKIQHLGVYPAPNLIVIK